VAEGEGQIRSAQATGMQTTVFRPSIIYGRDDHFLNLFAKLARIAPVLPVGCPKWVRHVLYPAGVPSVFRHAT